MFQIGFRLAKYLGQTKVIGVNYFESTSQSLLSAGENIGRYQDALAEFRNTGRGITKEFLQGGLSIADFLMELNRPDKVKMSHRLLYNTPAYVKDGSFNSYKDLGQIDNQYIGAEFISLFYKRNLKIYSNILNAQLSDESTKILLIVGQTHVGVLQGLFRENDSYEVVDVLSYLK
ncbi:MAG: hypothetical protein HRT61_08845 [Ekhidna sp.]|nr:hypothetical protein [Ekhidna sp.]